MVKTNAPELLRMELESTRWNAALVMSGVTDPYHRLRKVADPRVVSSPGKIS